MKDIIMMSIYGRHNRCNVSMYDSNTYKGLKSSVIEVDANLYRDLSVEFGLIRMALGMIRSVETVAFKNVGTMLQSKKVTVTTHYEDILVISLCICCKRYTMLIRFIMMIMCYV